MFSLYGAEAGAESNDIEVARDALVDGEADKRALGVPSRIPGGSGINMQATPLM